MPIANYSIGKDLSFTLVTSTGTLSLSGITDYTIKPMFTKLKHKGLDGNVVHAAIPDGWEINFKVERQDPTIDNYFAALEASYFAGTNITGATVSETITENNGSVSQFQYDNVSLSYEDAGSWKGDALIAVTVSGMASHRRKVA